MAVKASPGGGKGKGKGRAGRGGGGRRGARGRRGRGSRRRLGEEGTRAPLRTLRHRAAPKSAAGHDKTLYRPSHSPPCPPDRHHDRAAARGAHRRRPRQDRRVLQLVSLPGGAFCWGRTSCCPYEYATGRVGSPSPGRCPTRQHSRALLRHLLAGRLAGRKPWTQAIAGPSLHAWAPPPHSPAPLISQEPPPHASPPRNAHPPHLAPSGTNDLTQTTMGISRDDAQAKFLNHYLKVGPHKVKGL